MKKISAGSTVVLLMDINSPETPFFAKVGDSYVVVDINIDPNMPSGHNVRLHNYAGAILVDRSAVVHVDDWKNIHNAVLSRAMRSFMI